MSRRPFGLALVCFAAATSLSAQPAAGSRPSVTMVVSVQAKKTVVVKDGEAQLHWVIAELPKPETIDMGGDEAFRRELASVLSGLAARKGAGEGKCLDLVAEIDADNEACSLWDALRKTFALPRRIGLSAADPTTVGSWRTDAPQADNQLRYVVNGAEQPPLKAAYAFNANNQLVLTLAGDGGQSASFTFQGRIEILRDHNVGYFLTSPPIR